MSGPGCPGSLSGPWSSNAGPQVQGTKPRPAPRPREVGGSRWRGMERQGEGRAQDPHGGAVGTHCARGNGHVPQVPTGVFSGPAVSAAAPGALFKFFPDPQMLSPFSGPHGATGMPKGLLS